MNNAQMFCQSEAEKHWFSMWCHINEESEVKTEHHVSLALLEQLKKKRNVSNQSDEEDHRRKRQELFIQLHN